MINLAEMRQIPLISIIMPAYNAEKYIKESIESVLLQTYSHWELIVVDDGSTDSTSDVVKRYMNDDSRIRYIHQANGRQGKARNNGIENAQGDYIAFLDSDDLWLLEKLAIQVEFILANEVDLVFGYCETFNDKLNTKNVYTLELENVFFQGNDSLALFLEANQIPILTVMCKKSSLYSVNLFTENILIQNAEDYHLWLKLIINECSFARINYVVAGYRDHSASVTSADKFSFKQVVEAQYDLCRNGKYESQKLICEYLPKTIKKSLTPLEYADDQRFYEYLYRYLFIANKILYIPIFNIFKFFSFRYLSNRFAFFIFNYLN